MGFATPYEPALRFASSNVVLSGLSKLDKALHCARFWQGAGMIFKRLNANLRAQNWFAIGIELMIVIIGVFIGTWVANWNQERAERRAAEKMVQELRPGLKVFIDFFDTAKPYYATTMRYADKAFAGWRSEPGVSDRDFVIAAYQASQAYTLGLNAVTWTQVFGGNQLSRLEDNGLRTDLANLMSLNFEMIDSPAIYTTYRENVRKVIPEDIQDGIRRECGDRARPDRPLTQFLPEPCNLQLPAENWAAAAADLRAQPDLVRELRWHRAAVAAFLSNMDLFEQQTREVMRRIEANDLSRRQR